DARHTGDYPPFCADICLSRASLYRIYPNRSRRPSVWGQEL
ncbi:MAG: hypothetical protein, partial [Olavius algarvensis Gamma 3 endosymbiont]